GVYPLNDEENTERNDEEFNDHVDEITIHNGDFGDLVGFICWLDDIFQFSEIDTSGEVTDGRHNHIIDQGGNDFAEGPADDHTDSKVYHATTHGEFLELFHKSHKQ